MAATRGEESRYAGARVRRDSTATVIARGQGMDRGLLVNGVGMTVPDPDHQAHGPPAAGLPRGSRRGGLVSLLRDGHQLPLAPSWGIETTGRGAGAQRARALRRFFHPDGARLLASPSAHVVIDDGRRFLERTASSTTRSSSIRPRPWRPRARACCTRGSSTPASGGTWPRTGSCSTGSPAATSRSWPPSSAPSATPSRTCARSRPWTAGESTSWPADRPIPPSAPADLRQPPPGRGRDDLVEWGPRDPPRSSSTASCARKVPLGLHCAWPRHPRAPDDRPINEYYLLRHAARGRVRRFAGALPRVLIWDFVPPFTVRKTNHRHRALFRRSAGHRPASRSGTR